MDKHRPISPQRKKRLAWTALVIFVLLTAAVCWFVDGHGLWGRVLYVGMCFLQVVVAIIPGEPLEIAGGYAFGAVWGTVLCLIGLFLGSVVIFALVRRFGQSVVEVFFPPEKLHSLRFLQSSPKRNLLFWIVFTVPGTPKDLLCYFARAASLSRVVDHRGRRARPAQLSVRGARLRGDDAHLARGHRDLPDALPPPCPSSGAIMQSCKNIRPWQPPADVLYCGRLIFR